MDLLPSYADLLGATLPPVRGWNVGRNADWAMGIPNQRMPDTPSGWRLRIACSPEDLPRAWDAVRPILAEFALPARVALPRTAEMLVDPLTPGGGALIVVVADTCAQPGIAESRWWNEVAGRIEKTLTAHDIGRGLPVTSDRPIPGSGYLSVRCDAGPLGDNDAQLDFNPFQRPGSLWPVQVQGLGPIGDPQALLEAVVGPSRSIWNQAEDGWWLYGGLDELVPVKQAAQLFGLPATLRVEGQGYQLSWPESGTEALVNHWHEWREMTDVFRVIRGLRRRDVGVQVRRSDSWPPCVLVPEMSPEREADLVGVLARGGLALVRRLGGPLEIPIPGRVAADAFLASVSSEEGKLLAPMEIPPDVIDPPAQEVSGAQKQPRIHKPQMRRPQEIRAISRSASVAARRGASGTQKQKEAMQRLKKAGIVQVSVRTGLDRVMVPREREVGAPLEHDPRELLREMSALLGTAAKLRTSDLSSQQRAKMLGASLGMERLQNRPDLSMGRAFEAVKKGNSIVSGTIENLREHGGKEAIDLADALTDLSGKVQGRVMAGGPQVKLALTPEEIQKVRSGQHQL